MKITTAIILSLTISTTTFAASTSPVRSKDKLKLSTKTHEVLTLKKISKTKFEKISDSATGVVEVSMDIGGLSKSYSQELSESDTESKITYEATGKNVLKIQDTKALVDSEVQAEIRKSIFGNIKGIRIDSKTMEALYSTSIKKAGLDVFKKLNMLGGKVQSSLEVSDMNCTADGDILVCEQEANLELSIKN